MAEDGIPPKPLPEPTPVTEPFWSGLREGRVRIQYSPSSDRYIFYPRLLAPRTLADDLEWRDVSGEGVLYTYTIAEQPVAPPWRDSVPQFLVVVELDEGPRLSSELVGIEASDIEIGMRVKPVFEHHESVTLLKYTKA